MAQCKRKKEVAKRSITYSKKSENSKSKINGWPNRYQSKGVKLSKNHQRNRESIAKNRWKTNVSNKQKESKAND